MKREKAIGGILSFLSARLLRLCYVPGPLRGAGTWQRMTSTQPCSMETTPNYLTTDTNTDAWPAFSRKINLREIYFIEAGSKEMEEGQREAGIKLCEDTINGF